MALVLDGTGFGKIGGATVPDATGSMGVLAKATAQTASGTAVDFGGIPSHASRITVMLDGVSTSGTSIQQVRIGDSGGFVATGYAGATSNITATATTSVNHSTGFNLAASAAAGDAITGVLTLNRISGNTWVADVNVYRASAATCHGGSRLTLSGPLDRIRLTTVNGTDTFDAGTVNVMWE